MQTTTPVTDVFKSMEDNRPVTETQRRLQEGPFKDVNNLIKELAGRTVSLPRRFASGAVDVASGAVDDAINLSESARQSFSQGEDVLGGFKQFI